SPERVEAFNQALAQIKADGTLERIETRWRPQEMVFFSRERLERLVAQAVGAFFAVLVAGMALWVRLLKREIESRKHAQRESQRAGEALRQERDFSQTLVQASPAYFVALGPDRKVLMMNEALLQAVGRTADEVKGLDYLEHFVPES